MRVYLHQASSVISGTAAAAAAAESRSVDFVAAVVAVVAVAAAEPGVMVMVVDQPVVALQALKHQTEILEGFQEEASLCLVVHYEVSLKVDYCYWLALQPRPMSGQQLFRHTAASQLPNYSGEYQQYLVEC